MENRFSETMLVLLAQAGDREALNDLLKTVQATLYRYIFNLVGRHNVTEDILQEVFIIIYRKLGWLEEPKFFRAWTYRIATREAFKHLQREKRWSDQILDEAMLESLPAPSDLSTCEFAETLSQLLDSVSPASRAVLVLHYLQEMSIEEVADVLSLAVGTVKSRLSYGLACIRTAALERGLMGDCHLNKK
ncbi:MAG: RNA polymerase sigma factor [Acidobacteriota bacterium]